MELLTVSIEPDFEEAGWYPGRIIEVPQEVSETHPAFEVLRAFGGLTVGRCGPGEEISTSDIEFALGARENDLTQDWERVLKTNFVSVAECHHGHGELLLDHRGRLFQSGLVAPLFMFEGATFAEGVERVIRGRKARPMLLPWQQQTTIWGETIRSGDPRIMPLDFLNGS